MKVTMIEHEGCFSFEMTAETMQEAALLVRFGTNATTEIRSTAAMACKDGSFSGYCMIGKRKNANSYVRSANK